MAHSGNMSEALVSSGSIGWRLRLFIGFFIPLQVVTTALRFYARWLAAGSVSSLEDALVLVALVFQLALSAVGISSVSHAAVGRHLRYLEEHDPEKVVTWGKYLLVLATLYFVTVNIPKLAVLALYRRLFPMRTVQITVYVLAGILVSGSIANTITSLAACEPFEANWNHSIPGARCIDKESFFVWTSVPNILTDVIMLVLPLPIVWKLHNTKRIKVGLTLTFLVGSFGLITSILRFHTFLLTNSFTDGTYDAVELIIWTITEPGIYLISACLLTYRPLLERITKTKVIGGFKGRLPSSQRRGMGPGQGLGAEGTSEERVFPLRSLHKDNMGFTELCDEEYVGTIEASPLSPNVRKTRCDAITVTTDIHSSWASNPRMESV